MNTSKTPQTTSTAPIPKPKRGVKTYLAEVSRELKKVSWPSKEETTRLTGVVLAVCGLVIVILMALNETFSMVIDFLMNGAIS
jgi:preprotein translocase SecE subunit